MSICEICIEYAEPLCYCCRIRLYNDAFVEGEQTTLNRVRHILLGLVGMAEAINFNEWLKGETRKRVNYDAVFGLIGMATAIQSNFSTCTG